MVFRFLARYLLKELSLRKFIPNPVFLKEMSLRRSAVFGRVSLRRFLLKDGGQIRMLSGSLFLRAIPSDAMLGTKRGSIARGGCGLNP